MPTGTHHGSPAGSRASAGRAEVGAGAAAEVLLLADGTDDADAVAAWRSGCALPDARVVGPLADAAPASVGEALDCASAVLVGEVVALGGVLVAAWVGRAVGVALTGAGAVPGFR